MPVSLLELGWSEDLAERFTPYAAAGLEPARVLAVHRGHVMLPARLATLAGALLHRAEIGGPSVLPAVGDWVAAEPDGPVVHVLERRGALVRTDERGQDEVLAANVDLALAVSSLNADLSLRRLERFVAIARAGDVEASVLLTKSDLCADAGGEAKRVASALGVPALAISARTGEGLDELGGLLTPGRTVALLGMSGVGKSTLVNLLLGDARQRTLPVRDSDDRGRHATTHRELFVLPGGGLLVDTPGLRLPRIADASGLDDTFADITRLAAGCRFRDCSHDDEPGCAVIAAIEDGSLDPARLEAARKLRREAEWAATRADPLLAAARTARWKAITKEQRRRYREKGV